MKTKDLETKIRQAKLQLGDDFGDEKMMEEAIFKAGIKEENQRILLYLQKLQKSHPSINLKGVLRLIEASKPS